MRLVVSWNAYFPVVKVLSWGKSEWNNKSCYILSNSRLLVFAKDPSPILNVDKIGRSIQYSSYYWNVLDRVRLEVV